ncbi:MAG: hypothetical protein ACRBN8_19675 [Nannocystales bacterium]
MIGALTVGAGLGVFGVTMLGRAANRTLEGREVASVDRDRSVAVLLIGADHSSRVEKSVDERTGGRGFSHVVVDASERDETGARLVYECFPREGVRRIRFSERYGSDGTERMRPMVRAVIPRAWGESVRASLSALVGQVYDVWTAFLPSRKGLVCSRMVLRALPPALTANVRPHSDRHPISPNDLARAFGVSSPLSHDVMVTA